MQGIVYRSAPTIQVDWALMLDIVRAAERNNARDRLSGVLFFDATCFVQALFGEAADLESCFERLEADVRHEIGWTRRIELSAPWSRRSLPMGYVSARDVGSGAASALMLGTVSGDDAAAAAETLFRWALRKYPSLAFAGRPGETVSAGQAGSGRRAAALAGAPAASGAG